VKKWFFSKVHYKSIFYFFHIFDRNQYIVSYKFRISIKFYIDIRINIFFEWRAAFRQFLSKAILQLATFSFSCFSDFRFSVRSRLILMQNLMLIPNLYETIPWFGSKIWKKSKILTTPRFFWKTGRSDGFFNFFFIFYFFYIYNLNRGIVSYKFGISIKFYINIHLERTENRKSEKHENEKVASCNIALLKNWRKSSPPLKKYFFRLT